MIHLKDFECKRCGGFLDTLDDGRGNKFKGCYRCQEKEENCKCI